IIVMRGCGVPRALTPGVMAKVECTAVNELIDLVQNKRLERDSDEELLFQAPAPARGPGRFVAPPVQLFGSGPVFPADAPAIPAHPDLDPTIKEPRISDFEPPSLHRPSEPPEARATRPKLWRRKPQFEPTPPSDDVDTVYVPRQRPIDPI